MQRRKPIFLVCYYFCLKLDPNRRRLRHAAHHPTVRIFHARDLIHAEGYSAGVAIADAHKSSGPDGIPAIVLKQCAPEFCPVMARLFTLSSKKRHVPSSWKTALVHPVLKKGDRSDPSRYRPIAITFLLSKVMVRIINAKLLRYLEEHDLISDRQYGFRHGRSTGDLLLYLTHR